MIFGILFSLYLIWLIYSAISNDKIKREEEKKWEPYRYKKPVIDKDIRDNEQDHIDDINPWSHPM